MPKFLLAKKVNERSLDAIVDVENQKIMCVVDTRQQGEWVIKVLDLLERASLLVGNPGCGISSSTDIACDNWQKSYNELVSPQSNAV